MPPFNLPKSERVVLLLRRLAIIVWAWIRGPVLQTLTIVAARTARQIQRNLVPRRLLSFPHLLVAFWIIVLLEGQSWVFNSKVEDCAWKNWEQWPKGAKPHHLVFVADPQLIDPHSYPGRPWPISSISISIIDSYLRRSYNALLDELHPDSLFFLGDLFDGGREWKTAHGEFVDPKWGRQRDKTEQKWVKTWRRKYGNDYWLQEYRRFGDMFFRPWVEREDNLRPWQRGRKFVASLPGNHDLGFGAQVQVPVRDRFSAFFGDVNRVDVVGNHSIVSVDTVSLSADTSDFKNAHDLKPIYGPVNEFLEGVKSAKHRAVQEELDVWHGTDRSFRYPHGVGELDDVDPKHYLHPDLGSDAPDFPTILLSHVPLYRDVGKPCGPMREHWPPTKPPKGQTEPLNPDERNAISVVAGYQYQNVLSEEDSMKLVKSVGNVVHVFSGDDHDYCEIIHNDAKENVKEITVKSLSMAMGVQLPGFVMVSLYNPVDEHGRPLPGSPTTTLQTHLCLLPNQLNTFMKYITFAIVSLVLLAIRSFLVVSYNLTPFALEPEQAYVGLPVFKDKAEPPEGRMMSGATSSSSLTGQQLSSRLSATSSRTRNLSLSNGNGNGSTWQMKKGGGGRSRKRWNDWGGPRISLDESFYTDGRTWRAGRGRALLRTAWREMWTTSWRVAWMAVLVFVYLVRR